MDYLVYFFMCIFLIVGVYQFYFWTQNHPTKEARSLYTPLDDLFSLKPAWVWIYSGLYYPVIIAVVATVESMREFNYIAMSYFILLFMQMACFISYPVATPDTWRKPLEGNGMSERLLMLVHKYDKQDNCFPSMHVSVATLTAMHFMNNAPVTGNWPLLFPFLIALSALYTRQHYIADLLPGALLGWLAYRLFELMYIPL